MSNKKLITMLLVVVMTSQMKCNLFEAVKSQDLNEVQGEIQRNPESLYEKDEIGWTPLHYAANKANVDIVDALLKKGANSNASSETGLTPLMLATQSRDGSLQTIVLLIEAGAQTNYEDDRGYTALMNAVISANVDAVRYLLSEPSINVRSSNKLGQTALSIAKQRYYALKAQMSEQSEQDKRYEDKEKLKNYQVIGKLIINRLKLSGPEGRISKAGFLTGLPTELDEYIARLFPYMEDEAPQ